MRFLSTDKKDQGSLYKLFFDASYKRGIGGAVIFYIIQVLNVYVVVLVASKILFYILLFDINSTNFRFVLIAISAGYVLLLQLDVLRNKKILRNRFYLLIVVIFTLLSIFFGNLIGLLPTIYFVMQKERKNSASNK